MFSVHCQCGRPVNIGTARLNQPISCPSCKRLILCISAEPLDDTAAGADFDAALLCIDGPDRAGQLLRIGGSATIDIGTDPANHLILQGDSVSASHCQLARIGFGPSRWKIENASSEAKVYVNGVQITSHELADGDTLQIGDYEIAYKLTSSASQEIAQEDESPAEAAPSEVETSVLRAKSTPLVAPSPRADDWPVCPSCKRDLDPGARICVDCGIHIRSGRPLLMSEGLDENTIHGNAETALKFVSLLMWVTPLPIPLASSAYGKYKPYAIWLIAAITLIASGWFLAISWNGDPGWAKVLKLWPSNPNFSNVDEREIRMKPHIQTGPDGIPREMSYEERREQVIREHRRNSADFHWWQLFAHVLIEDPGSVLGFLFHLGGNLLFLIVFGSRVNAIIGNLATAIIYPLLAVATGLVFILKLPTGAAAPLLGASGVVNGMAGLYLVLLPAHYVYCATWFRFFRNLAFKIFALRGFWVVLIYFAYDVAMMLFGNGGTAGRWAGIGGFLIGVVIALALLVSRMINCQNGDLLSLLLGKYAWPLIGKPSQWEKKTVAS